MNRSQRILIAVGLLALALMSAPFVLRGLVDRQAVDGKVRVYHGRSERADKDLVLCLIKHPGTLNLNVASNDLYVDPVSGLAVLVIDRGSYREIEAFMPADKALNAAQTAQLKTCAG